MKIYLILMLGLAVVNGALFYTAPAGSAEGGAKVAGGNGNSVETMNQGNVAVYFGATWCGPCRSTKPVFSQLSKEMGSKCSLIMVDVDQHQALAQKYGIRSIPMIVVFKDGEEKGRFGGRPDKDYLKNQIEGNL